jgi:hypothetical protein
MSLKGRREGRRKRERSDRKEKGEETSGQSKEKRRGELRRCSWRV